MQLTAPSLSMGVVMRSAGKLRSETVEPAIDVKMLHAKIGALTLVNDFLSGALGKTGLLPSA